MLYLQVGLKLAWVEYLEVRNSMNKLVELSKNIGKALKIFVEVKHSRLFLSLSAMNEKFDEIDTKLMVQTTLNRHQL